jgi:phage shock protein PspC (stress-responsive transcriptional regulator)
MKPAKEVGRATCEEALEYLRSFLDGGTAPAPGHVAAHWRECSDCRRVVSAMQREIAALVGDGGEVSPDDLSAQEPARAATTAAVEAGRAVQRGFARWRAILILGLGIAGVAAGVGLMGPSGADWWPRALLASILLGLSVAAAGLVLSRAPSRAALYKRLRPGYQLSGVCLGLAEKTGIPVGILRAVFFGLAFADGMGIWIYVLLDLSMPVHPEDRRYLLRFRFLRWWRKTRATAEGASTV